MIQKLTWSEFDICSEKIANKVMHFKFQGIYGIPRGGLCLAVSLSHKLNLKLLDKAQDNSLIVDDIYDTGKTLNRFKNIKGAKYFVLFSRKSPIWWESIYTIENKDWILFPWEEAQNCITDKKKYEMKRNLL